MFIIYDLIFLLFALIYLPLFLFQKKLHAGFHQRLGILPRHLRFQRPIWLHAVSVGEVAAIRGLITELKINYPSKNFVVTTVTPTGNKVARSILRDEDFLSYLPLDFSFIVRSVIDRIQPAVFVIAETELWPNLISYLYKKDIPLVLVNGRISDRSFRGYLSIRFLLRPLLNKIDTFCVQTSLDAQRFLYLGVPENKIRITGNMKFDIADYTDIRRLPRRPDEAEKKDYTDLRTRLGLGIQEKLFVAGSTHPKEEEIILEAYKSLRSNYPYLRLLFAPRHPQRAKEVEKIISNFGFSSQFTSSLTPHPAYPSPQTVFILDSVGQLMHYYALADIVFVGGSLVKKGGHNILEPASLEKPILCGPYMFNFRDIAELFLKSEACILAGDAQELTLRIGELLDNPRQREILGKRARDLIVQNQGATQKTLEVIKNIIAH